MRTRLLNLAAAVSLLLSVAIIFLWIRSHGRHESIIHFWHTPTENPNFTEERRWWVHSLYGSLEFTVARSAESDPPNQGYAYADDTEGDTVSPEQQKWFSFPPLAFRHRFHPVIFYDAWEFTIAYWLLLPATLLLPVIAFARHRGRRNRKTNNLCPTCGYDLRATPDRCPECGTVPASSVGRAAT